VTEEDVQPRFEHRLRDLIAKAVERMSPADQVNLLVRLSAGGDAIMLDRFGDHVVVRLFDAPVASVPLSYFSDPEPPDPEPPDAEPVSP
jgi:hypothetical protein